MFASILVLLSCEDENQSGYNCIENSCSAVFENPQYLTLTDCQIGCDEELNPTSGYSCINNDCVYENSNAQYLTLADCQIQCDDESGSSSGYSCINNNCIYVNANAQFGSKYACESSGCEDDNETTLGSLRVNINNGNITNSTQQACVGYTAYELSVSTISGTQSGSGVSYFNYDNLEAGTYSLSLEAWCISGSPCWNCENYIDEFSNLNVTVVAGEHITVEMNTY